LETRGILVGIILSLIGLTLFAIGISSLTQSNALSNSFLTVIGIFMGMSGLLVLAMNLFSTMGR
jgi:hypothetical protein